MDDRGDYIKRKVARLEDLPDQVMKRIVALQNRLTTDLIDYYMGQLDIEGGNIVFNAQNQQVLSQMVEALKKEFEFTGNSDYDKIIEGFAREMNNQARITLQLLRTDFESLPDTYNKYFNFIKTEALKNFEMGNIEGTLIEPIRQTLASSMANGAKFNDTVSSLRVLMKGGEFDGRQVDGKLFNYMKTYTRTSFAEVDRGFTTHIATEIGVQWYYYESGSVKGTRQFCLERAGKYWHIKEIESWAKEDWAGKRQGTNSKNILQYLGGWNCMHSLIPVSEFSVPKKDQLRAQAKGFWKIKDVA